MGRVKAVSAVFFPTRKSREAAGAWRMVLVPLIAGALAACASQPDLGAAPKPLAAASLASARSFAAPAADWPADGWWRAYGDPQLDQLIEAALAGAPDMAAAKARLERAKAAADQARAALFPSLSAGGLIGQAKQSYNYGFPKLFVPKGYLTAPQISLNFDYEIDFWGKNRNAVAAATSEARAAAADAAEARLTLSTAVAAAYADLARLHAERAVAARSLASREETLDLVRRRVANGVDSEAELDEAAAGPPAARAELAAVDEQIALIRDQLAALIGQGPDRGLSITPPGQAALKAFGLPDRLAADLIGRRPDLAAAKWRAQAAARRIGVAKAAFYPNVNLSAVIGYESLGLTRLVAAGSDYGQYGAAVSLPIFEGGRLIANLRGARADYDAAVASYDATLIQALREVADAAASQRALVDRLKQSREALADEEAAYRIARLRYEGGVANYQMVLLAEDAVLRARRDVVDLEARAFSLDIQLIKALGGGFAGA